MSVTSIPFALFVIVTIICYFAFPKREYRWVILLAASSFYYVYNSLQYSAFIVLTIITVYSAARWMQAESEKTREFLKGKKDEWSRDERKSYKTASEKKRKAVLAGTLILNFGILFLLKYFNFMSEGLAGLIGKSAGDAPHMSLLLPLGISFYTFISTGYLIDVYREKIEPEHNILKFALFVSFFPHIVQGPISSFDKLHEQLIEPHRLEWLNFKHGFMNICWGLFKKLVIADTSYIAIKAYNDNGGIVGNEEFSGYGGTMVLFIVLLYAVQLYADFSGGIDISRGICRVLGIDLEVNFRQPYFSKSISEYWRRWHISLGAWMKNYVFYPIAMSGFSAKVSKGIAKSGFGQTAVGKHLSKVMMTAVASFIVFLLVGIWHGANSKYIAFGVWNGAIIMISALLGPVYARTKSALHIKDEALWWQLFQMIRTFFIVFVGYVLDIAVDFKNSLQMMQLMLTDQNKSVFMEHLHTLGMRKVEYLAIGLCSLLLFYISIRLEHTKLDTPAELLERRNGFIQWICLFGLIMLIIIFGAYGPSYDPTEFVYMQF